MMTDRDKIICDFSPIPVRAALDPDLGAAPLRVLILLTAYVGKDATCFPSQTTLAKKLGITRQAVGQHIKALKERGYIRATRQRRENGSDTSCLYEVVYVDTVQADLAGASSSCTPLKPELAGESTACSPLQVPDLSPPASSEACTQNIPIEQTKEALLGDFEVLWQAYPRREGANPKKPAQNKFLRLVKEGVDPRELIYGAESYARAIRAAGKENTAYVAQMQTWLNQERWKDQQDVVQNDSIGTSLFETTGGKNWTGF